MADEFLWLLPAGGKSMLPSFTVRLGHLSKKLCTCEVRYYYVQFEMYSVSM